MCVCDYVCEYRRGCVCVIMCVCVCVYGCTVYRGALNRVYKLV